MILAGKNLSSLSLFLVFPVVFQNDEDSGNSDTDQVAFGKGQSHDKFDSYCSFKKGDI